MHLAPPHWRRFALFIPANCVTYFRVCPYVTANNTGRIIAPHVQGLIWRETPGLRARCAQLGAGLASADPLRLLAIREAAGGFAGAVGYMVKPPYHDHRLWQDRSGRFHHRGEKPDPYPHFTW
jgi:hypothetical protein